MIDSNEYKDQENKESDTALVPSELHILVTDADTNGYEISKMSDFMGLYAQQLIRSLADSPFVEVVSNIPVADLGIINDVVQHAAVVARGNITLVPDFDSLPAGIKEKLKQSLYSIGDSKQVDGNLRAVIVDENGVRVKDITLKKVAEHLLEQAAGIALKGGAVRLVHVADQAGRPFPFPIPREDDEAVEIGIEILLRLSLMLVTISYKRRTQLLLNRGTSSLKRHLTG